MEGFREMRFKHRDFAALRRTLLEDTSKEQFAVLFGKLEQLDGAKIVTVREMRFPGQRGYMSQSLTHLEMDKGYVHRMLAEVQHRLDIDVIIDVHTHPFSDDSVAFSWIDDADEKRFAGFLNDRFGDLHYASLVLARGSNAARFWNCESGKASCEKASVKTQTMQEQDYVQSSPLEKDLMGPEALHSRSTLALGLEVMRRIVSGQKIVLVGVGGIGSVMAEHLVHQGFNRIGLIDPDHLEISNMNRFVGASMEQAIDGVSKVEAVKQHVKKINPDVEVEICPQGIDSTEAEQMILGADWMLVSTDNHSSRLKALELSMRFFVPMIAAGVNITVENSRIMDMSGEVITARAGDRYCLSCLGRINLAQVTAESHPEQAVRELTVTRGYVQGREVKEPAVKTLNTMLATMAVDSLLNQYIGDKATIPVLVYENNGSPCIYPDTESVFLRNHNCPYCGV